MLACALLSLLFFFFPFRVQLCHLLWIYFFTPENRQAIGMIPFTCRLFDHLTKSSSKADCEYPLDLLSSLMKFIHGWVFQYLVKPSFFME